MRIVTLNVADGLCSTAVKSEGFNRWCALARLVAALDPDVLLLQEAGDNAGNGTGDGVDGVAGLEATLRLFVSGGTDPFVAGAPQVSAFVQAYDPEVELPYVFVSARTDGYNRNALLSRFPFTDLNGDGKAVQSDMPPVLPVDWAAGGDGGLRGWQLAEIDLPDRVWAGDLVVGNSHLKAGTSAADHAARVEAARNIAYYVHHVLHGAGAGLPDPWDAVADEPAVQFVLGEATALVTGGDWNEDELLNGDVEGPAAWIGRAAVSDRAGGADGPDRDGTDLCVAKARDPFTASPATHFGTTRDYLAFGDAVAAEVRAFVFDTASLPPGGRATPPELLGFSGGWAGLSAVASDHRAVCVDLALPKKVSSAVGDGEPGAGGVVPRMTARAATGRGGAVTLRLHGVPAGTPAWLLVSRPTAAAPAGRVPWPMQAFGPVPVGPGGALDIKLVPGRCGRDPFLARWLVPDVSGGGGAGLSNVVALRPPP